MAFIKALIFDLDNTLFDRDAVARNVLIEMGLVANLGALMDVDCGGMSDRLDFARQAIRIAGLKGSAEEFWDEFRERVADSVAPEPEIRAMLARLRQEYRVGVLSNGGASNQRRKIRNLGIEDVLDALVISGEHPFQKPDARAFLYMCDLLKSPPGNTLMIGNDYDVDILGAREAGLQTLLVGGAGEFAHVRDVEAWLATQARNSAS